MSEARDFESEARAGGWVPEAEWQGNPDKKPKTFLSAEQFVLRGENMAGHMKRELQKVQQTSAEFRNYMDAQLKKEKDRADKAIADLKTQQAQAVSDGDGASFQRLSNEIDQVQAEINSQPSAPNSQNTGMPPEAVEFQSENPWYGTDTNRTAFADGIANQIVSEGYTGKAYFNELARRVNEVFPTQTKAPSTPDVEQPQSGQVSNPGSQTYDSLPAEAKAECDGFVKSIPGFTKETYLEQYDWS